MADALDPRELRKALGSFTTGVTIVTTRDPDGRDVGVTANSFNSVSLDPPMVLWSLAKSSGSLQAFTGASHFAVHILAVDQDPLSDRFASKGTDKFAGLDLHRSAHGVPLLAGCSALFQCRTAYRYEGGDHVIFVGEVVAFEHLEKPPLVFHGGRYAVARTKPAAAPALDGEIGESTLGNLITRAFLQLVTPLKRNAERLGLSAPERYMMNVLMAGGAYDLEGVNAIISHTGAAISAETAQGLVERGLVVAEATSGTTEYHPSDKGRHLMIELLAAARAHEEDALVGLSEEEQRVLGDLLTRLVSGLNAGGDQRVTRHIDLLNAARAARSN